MNATGARTERGRMRTTVAVGREFRRSKRIVTMFSQLVRYRLSAMVAASALAGYALYPAPPQAAEIGFLWAGVFLLAAGCSALNQVQERRTDALMERTRRRPVASGRLSPRAAAAIAAGLLAAGLGLLFLTAKGPAVWLGLFAVLWYNGVYTRLKRITASAALPGALCGAIPPLMGWTCAGGGLAAPRIVLFSGILVLWQLPHFWLFAIKYREDFKKAGFPPLFPQLTEVRLRLIILAWVLSAAASTLLLGAFGMLAGIEAKALCLVAVCWIFASVGRAMLKGGEFFYSGKVFFRLNLFMGLTIGSVVLDRLLASLPF